MCHFTLLLFHLQTPLIFLPINFVLSTVLDKIQAWLCLFHCCRLHDNILISIISSFPIFKVGLIFLLWFFNLHKGYWDFMCAHLLSSPLSFIFLSLLFVFYIFIYVFTLILVIWIYIHSLYSTHKKSHVRVYNTSYNALWNYRL